MDFTVKLEATVAGLQRISDKLDAILPGMEAGPVRDDLRQMRQQAQAAIAYYAGFEGESRPPILHRDVLSRAQRVGLATFGAAALGLFPPEFPPNSIRG